MQIYVSPSRISNKDKHAVEERQKAVAAYISSKQLLYFDYADHYCNNNITSHLQTHPSL